MDDEIQYAIDLLHVCSSVRSLHRFSHQSSQHFRLSALNLLHFDREIFDDTEDDFLERCGGRIGLRLE